MALEGGKTFEHTLIIYFTGTSLLLSCFLKHISILWGTLVFSSDLQLDDHFGPHTEEEIKLPPKIQPFGINLPSPW